MAAVASKRLSSHLLLLSYQIPPPPFGQCAPAKRPRPPLRPAGPRAAGGPGRGQGDRDTHTDHGAGSTGALALGRVRVRYTFSKPCDRGSTHALRWAWAWIQPLDSLAVACGQVTWWSARSPGRKTATTSLKCCERTGTVSPATASCIAGTQ